MSKKRRRRGRKREDKAKTEVRHFLKRCTERYSLWLTDEDVADVVAAIQAGQGEHLERQSRRVSVWLVTIKDKQVPVVYDSDRKAPTTALPWEYVVTLRAARAKAGQDVAPVSD